MTSYNTSIRRFCDVVHRHLISAPTCFCAIKSYSKIPSSTLPRYMITWYYMDILWTCLFRGSRNYSWHLQRGKPLQKSMVLHQTHRFKERTLKVEERHAGGSRAPGSCSPMKLTNFHHRIIQPMASHICYIITKRPRNILYISNQAEVESVYFLLSLSRMDAGSCPSTSIE